MMSREVACCPMARKALPFNPAPFRFPLPPPPPPPLPAPVDEVDDFGGGSPEEGDFQGPSISHTAN